MFMLSASTVAHTDLVNVFILNTLRFRINHELLSSVGGFNSQHVPSERSKDSIEFGNAHRN